MFISDFINWITGLPWLTFFFGLLISWFISILFRKCRWPDLLEGLFVIGLMVSYYKWIW